ncbi:MAG: hypothetical protein COY42_03930 [Armatimonadetes bacterium CG_4_10_14_0_8_um_filter_66_14]|nr:hypothetical protein [Armatimonadota bacterium]NCO90736.1 hypothetical protein [Armatimonadota bacterium]OIO95192.1 MAG: hypothetical protein AUJ96_27325 [Armatimonadetes bacterium CG2_30_66_41]PIZ49435.1 MAG: hypothetical protein COY42_03930 [Armatimonadetes bacterium CG_4_10_14_0_8_um_filter_66_14]
MSDPTQPAYVYVSRQGPLDALTRQVEGAVRVAIDTEANSLYRYRERVCLIQLSVDGDNHLVDPLARLDLTGFMNALAGKPLIFHGADYDLRMMRSSFGFRPGGWVFDTMIAAQLVGYEQVGLASLVERFFGVTLSKGAQKSDWTRRPLPARELAYAAADTRYLPELAELLREELQHLGRLGWHEEACERLIEATAEDNHRDPETEWRVKGVSRLDRQQLVFARQLWYWREREAERADLPPFKIVGNEQLVSWAVWAAAHPGESLEQGPRLPRTCSGRRLRELERAIREAQQRPQADWPQRRVRRPAERSAPDCRPLTDALVEECARVAGSLHLPPSVIAPRAALTALSRARPHTLEQLMESGPLMRWQAELLAPGFRELLQREW